MFICSKRIVSFMAWSFRARTAFRSAAPFRAGAEGRHGRVVNGSGLRHEGWNDLARDEQLVVLHADDGNTLDGDAAGVGVANETSDALQGFSSAGGADRARPNASSSPVRYARHSHSLCFREIEAKMLGQQNSQR